MTDTAREDFAAAALAPALRRAWPERAIEKFAAGWATRFLVALRADLEVRAYPHGTNAWAFGRRFSRRKGPMTATRLTAPTIPLATPRPR
jgi:hypothetical protein